MISITVKSANRTFTGYVPTRDEHDAPLDLELFARLVRQQAETLAWMVLGYPETDMLEMGLPWRMLEQNSEQEEAPAREICSHCGRYLYRHLSSAGFSEGCGHWDIYCTCLPLLPNPD